MVYSRPSIACAAAKSPRWTARRMRIEGDDDRSASRSDGIVAGAPDHRLMAEMHTVKDADRQEERSANGREISDGRDDVQEENATSFVIGASSFIRHSSF